MDAGVEELVLAAGGKELQGGTRTLDGFFVGGVVVIIPGGREPAERDDEVGVGQQGGREGYVVGRLRSRADIHCAGRSGRGGMQHLRTTEDVAPGAVDVSSTLVRSKLGPSLQLEATTLLDVNVRGEGDTAVGGGGARLVEIHGDGRVEDVEFVKLVGRALELLEGGLEGISRLLVGGERGGEDGFHEGGVDGCDCAEILSLIEQGKIDTTPLITHRYHLADIEKAYRIFENHLDGVIKIAITE